MVVVDVDGVDGSCMKNIQHSIPFSHLAKFFQMFQNSCYTSAAFCFCPSSMNFRSASVCSPSRSLAKTNAEFRIT